MQLKKITKKLTIAIVVGEASGDALGSGLMKALKCRGYDISFIGIGGPKMQAEGFQSFFEMERLAVMGIIEPILRLPELLGMRRFILRFFTQNPPDIYIGIDAPDFNLGIASILKSRGIKTVHYVSPTIWAWRPNRLKKIVKALNHILLIFPFEADIYQKTPLSYDYVGHPLAEELELSLDKIPDKTPARVHLDCDLNSQIIAILPGSRDSEIRAIAPDFIKTAHQLWIQDPTRVFLAAMLNEAKATLFSEYIVQMNLPVPIRLVINQTRTVLQACDVAMVVSGTATLETALMKRPFIVGYKMGSFQYQIAKRVIRVPYIAMPNIIANRRLVTEYIQDNLNPIKMAQELDAFLKSPTQNAELIKDFTDLHRLLKQNGSEKAAQAVLTLIEGKA